MGRCYRTLWRCLLTSHKHLPLYIGCYGWWGKGGKARVKPGHLSPLVLPLATSPSALGQGVCVLDLLRSLPALFFYLILQLLRVKVTHEFMVSFAGLLCILNSVESSVLGETPESPSKFRFLTCVPVLFCFVFICSAQILMSLRGYMSH